MGRRSEGDVVPAMTECFGGRYEGIIQSPDTLSPKLLKVSDILNEEISRTPGAYGAHSGALHRHPTLDYSYRSLCSMLRCGASKSRSEKGAENHKEAVEMNLEVNQKNPPTMCNLIMFLILS
jgi:hypothetical protein